MKSWLVVETAVHFQLFFFLESQCKLTQSKFQQTAANELCFSHRASLDLSTAVWSHHATQDTETSTETNNWTWTNHRQKQLNKALHQCKQMTAAAESARRLCLVMIANSAAESASSDELANSAAEAMSSDELADSARESARRLCREMIADSTCQMHKTHITNN